MRDLHRNAAFATNFFSNGVLSDSFEVLFPATNADPGPSRGQLPTDPMLAGGPVVNRALLDQLFPAGTRRPNTGDVWFDNPERRLALARQYSIGYVLGAPRTAQLSARFTF
jgi:hypothetical protein